MESANHFGTLELIQTVFWNRLSAKKSSKFILIDHFNAPIVKKKNSDYTNYFAIANERIEKIDANKGDKIMLSIPNKSFRLALDMLSREKKLPFLDESAKGQDAYIELKKGNEQRIDVLNIELRAKDENLTKEANEQYQIIRLENEAQKEREEERSIKEGKNLEVTQ